MSLSLYSDDVLTRRQQYALTRAALLNDRASFESHWRELSNFIKPRRTRWFTGDKNRGDKRNQNIIDGSATYAADTLRSGMHAGLTSPARPWFRLTTPDPELAEFGPVKEWLHTVTQRMQIVLLKTNVYNTLPTVYGDMGTFASSAMGLLEDDKDLLRGYSYPIGSYMLGVDNRGRVNTFVRDYTMTVRDVVKEFGVIPGTKQIDWSNLSQAVRDAWERGRYTQSVDVCWIITPNEDADSSRLASKYLPFHSCWFESGVDDKGGDGGKFLRERGFNEFPILAPRWEVTGEDTYGTECPGMTSLGDIKQLQLGERRTMQAVEKMVNPPVQGPTSLRNQKTSLLPGDVTYVDVMQGQQGLRPIHDMNFAVDKLEMKQQAVRDRIRQAYYTDLFLMMAMSDRREITAREVDERHEEKLLALGPVLERAKDELHEPLIDRVYSIMNRAGLIPPAPRELHGTNLKVEYLSLMASAQKLLNVASHERFMQGTIQLLQVAPEARHKIDFMQSIEVYGDELSINPKIIRTDEEAQALAQQEQQALAQQQQAENMRNVASSARDLSQSDMTGNNALTQIIQSARGV